MDQLLGAGHISEHIPDEVFSTVKRRFSDNESRFEVRVVSFALFSTDKNETREIRKREYLFELSGK